MKLSRFVLDKSPRIVGGSLKIWFYQFIIICILYWSIKVVLFYIHKIKEYKSRCFSTLMKWKNMKVVVTPH